jgi:hypothetical protein
MPNAAALEELERRIAIVRDNLRELIEEATAFSGAANDTLISGRIADQEAELAALLKERDALAK